MGRLVFGVFGPRKPILGTELAGVVEAVGKSVTRFKPGDSVSSHSSGRAMGATRSTGRCPEDGLIALKPENLTFEEAATLSFGGTTALSYLRQGRHQSR